MADKEIHLRHPLQRIIPGAPVRAGLEILEVLEDRLRKMEIEQSICSCSPEEPILLCTSDLLEHLLHSESRRWLSLSLSLSHDPCRKKNMIGIPHIPIYPAFPQRNSKMKKSCPKHWSSFGSDDCAPGTVQSASSLPKNTRIQRCATQDFATEKSRWEFC